MGNAITAVTALCSYTGSTKNGNMSRCSNHSLKFHSVPRDRDVVCNRNISTRPDVSQSKSISTKKSLWIVFWNIIVSNRPDAAAAAAAVDEIAEAVVGRRHLRPTAQ